MAKRKPLGGDMIGGLRFDLIRTQSAASSGKKSAVSEHASAQREFLRYVNRKKKRKTSGLY